MTVSDADFRRYQRLVLQDAGIQLGETKRALLTGRLAKRLRELDLSGYGAYYERLLADPAERVRMLDLIATNETSFFREPRQFEFLAQHVTPALRAGRARTLRVWSAGCATGEEPYSLAMLLHSRLEGWTIDILATDLSTTALERARDAVWPIAKASAIPEELLRRYMLRGVHERAGSMAAGDELRSMIRFARLNLNEPFPIAPGTFDLVFCRNVLIYFETEARKRALARLIESCAAGGYVFVGHAETLQGCAGVRGVQPTIWRRV